MNDKINDGGPAFPYGIEKIVEFSDGSNEIIESVEEGMSLRDYFAAKAMTGIIGNSEVERAKHQENDPDYFKKISTLSYMIADAMIEARNK